MYCPKCGLENIEDAKICLSCGQLLPVEETPLPPQIPAKTSALAVWSFVLALMGLFTFMITALPALICGIVGLVKISKSKGQLRGTGLAVAGIAIPSVEALFILLIILAILMSPSPKYITQKIMCGTNVGGLGKAMIVYVEDHNDMYPPAENWCDVLIKECNVNPNQFCCPGGDAKEGQSSYALNINVAGKKASEIPPDIVLLFETKPGVNPAGGPEIINTDNHQGNGCNVLFANGHANFIKPEEFRELRWKPE